jgi:hypothetical protein
LAVVNLDWSVIRAVDIFALFESIVPGKTKSVTIYPSEYGLAKLAQETTQGPLISSEDPEELRQYEMDKLKYYFAIANFKKVSYAEKVYIDLEGLEFEHTSN